MLFELKYGAGTLPLRLPDALTVDVFQPRTAIALEDPAAALDAALDTCLGSLLLEAREAPRSVAVAVPDETRPFPLKRLLPRLLDRLFSAYPSLSGDQVVIVVGGGLHPPADAAQLARILPKDLRGCRVVSHDAENSPVTSCGLTSRGTPVEINAQYAAAELKIVMGVVEPHQFVGFTGGAKGVTVGCASAAAIAANHRMLRHNRAVAAEIEDNPVRLDLNEAGDMAGVALAVNVVLDADKRPAAILVGRPSTVMREAARLAARVYGLRFDRPYDIVVASCGGLPKDICLYQAQKGLSTAAQCAAPEGRILLVAECAQGIGDRTYADYVRRFGDARSLMTDFENSPFVMGAHKGYLFARVTTRFIVAVQTDLSPETLAACHLTCGPLQETVDRWLAEVPGARVAVIKNANSSFFTRTGKHDLP